MAEIEYTLEEISYSRKEDCRIIETVLKNWFRSPKILNYVDPRLSFPFQFKKWVALSYLPDDITTIVCKKENWIIGYLSLKVLQQRGHLFHLFVDPEFRNKGLAIKMIQAVESHGIQQGVNTFTLNVVPKNESAIKLYEKLGYKNVGESETKSLKMAKSV